MTKQEAFDLIFLRFARDVAQLSTCKRAKVGAVLVTGDQIVSYGYNGAPRGEPHCIDPCQCVHAEANALIKSISLNMTLYSTTVPCLRCAQLIVNSNIQRVLAVHAYRCGDGLDLLKRADIPVDLVGNVGMLGDALEIER